MAGLRKSAEAAENAQATATATEDNAANEQAQVVEQPDAAVAEPEVIPAGAPNPTPAAAAAPVVAAKPALPSLGKKFAGALIELENQIDPSSVDFDTFRRVTVGLDGFSDENEVALGKRIKVQVMSYNERYVVSPGVDDDEASKLVKFSLDGVNLDDGSGTVVDYIKQLKDVDGYENAASKKYLAIYGFLVASAETENSSFVEIDPADREIVNVQVPPRSFGKFSRYQIEQGVKISQGVVQPTDLLTLTQGKVKGKTKTYAEITFSRGDK